MKIRLMKKDQKRVTIDSNVSILYMSYGYNFHQAQKSKVLR